MKINIWKLLLAALVVPAAMGACTDERNNFMVDDRNVGGEQGICFHAGLQ